MNCHYSLRLLTGVLGQAVGENLCGGGGDGGLGTDGAGRAVVGVGAERRAVLSEGRSQGEQISTPLAVVVHGFLVQRSQPTFLHGLQHGDARLQQNQQNCVISSTTIQ